MPQATEAASKRRGKAKTPTLSREEMLRAYRDMLLIRRFEEKAGQLYGMGLIGGFCHLYIGQEAVVVGVQMCLKPGDQVITSYRDHGHMLATGMEARGVMAELTGRIGGYSKGKGGSMHMFSREKGFYGGHGIVGAQVSLGNGLAFANWYRQDGRVAVTYFGEGASNQGQVYESLNLAALFKLPCIFIIENNKYGMGTSVDRASASRDLSQNGAAWGIPGEQVNGMDVASVREAGERAVAHCRAGKGPYLLEMKTYRYRGHSMSDPAKYRTREEVQKMRETSDCIETARKALLDDFGVTEADLKVIDDEVKAIVQDSADFAQESPEPPESELMTDILVEAN
ncbi:MAG: pyruvate dehydrogenase (acetyl-transferring) E1 component subunit alpha [Roseomonas sp.]|nr:pyruvate dehydrogenase (acetyl-transferring) E1 component subunit alpha [Roseomonas sp.]MCA3327912.1 pyruvate dehydrogenase (acetyl-transferring) E1 component subunit alpha [Roseomonas sp.]MCA3331704.1 pyruvate dehydrogenase (acetyl-transferring) E1 component subunit alpha [Roseomonas sp.]MCA3333281.1 pyruvate dehydrogenase (acetyl-transferring) E1 component subunit alpha [Roseomonas sp.]MCA3348131.1 pyruvate dehydrogenase (acetyl-transferring) E1 component subunit alpha [Roseomonas sp.]